MPQATERRDFSYAQSDEAYLSWFRRPETVNERVGTWGTWVPDGQRRAGYSTRKLGSPYQIQKISENAAIARTPEGRFKHQVYEVLIADSPEGDVKIWELAQRAIREASVVMANKEVSLRPSYIPNTWPGFDAEPVTIDCTELLVDGQPRSVALILRVVDNTPGQHEKEYFYARNAILDSIDGMMTD